MKQVAVKNIIVLTVLLTTVLFSSLAFAKSFQQPSGTPPFGLKIQGAAAGTKVSGTVTLEEYDVDEYDNFSNIKIAMRLEMNNAVQLFYDEVHTAMNGSNPGAVQDLIMSQMSQYVIAFCTANSKSSCGNTVTVKNISDFEFLDSTLLLGHRFVTFDIVVAVQ